MRLARVPFFDRGALSLFLSIKALSVGAWGRHQTLAMSSGGDATHRMQRNDGYVPSRGERWRRGGVLIRGRWCVSSYGGKGVALIPSSGTASSTIIWLHGLGEAAGQQTIRVVRLLCCLGADQRADGGVIGLTGDTGEGWLGGIPHNRFPNTKFIFPTAPVRCDVRKIASSGWVTVQLTLSHRLGDPCPGQSRSTAATRCPVGLTSPRWMIAAQRTRGASRRPVEGLSRCDVRGRFRGR